MFKENQAEFDRLNISLWSSLKSKGTVVVLDDKGMPFDFTNVETPFKEEHRNTTDHNTYMCCVAREISSDLRIISIPWTGTTSAHRVKVVDWIYEHKDEIDVISCSFGSSHDEFDRLKDLDIPVVCATGNSYSDTKIHSPAKYDWTIAVGEVSEASGNVTGQSNKGEELDIVSYGSIRVPKVNGSWELSGTSCATIVVSSMLGMYIAFRREHNFSRLDRESIRQFTHTNAVDMYEVGHDYKSGYGLFVLPSKIPEIEVREPVIIIPEPIEIPKEDNNMFKDTDTHWAKDYIDYVVSKGYMKGNEDGTFEPEGNITRAEFAVVLARKDGFEPVKK